MAIDREELWRTASDEEVIKARENFEGVNERARRAILAEIEGRGLEVPLWKCVNCGIENPQRAGECRECGSDQAGNAPLIEYKPAGVPTRQCIVCGKETAQLRGLPELERFAYCLRCATEEISKVTISTTHLVDGYRVKRYIDIQTAEVVIGTGPFSEFKGAIADFLGERATEFERKLHQARRAALDNLRLLAIHLQGNAVIGIDLDYTEFSSNRIGVVASGTVVELERIPTLVHSAGRQVKRKPKKTAPRRRVQKAS